MNSVIMVGVDGSDTSMRAAALAAGLARRQGARLVAVFVAAPSPWVPVGAPGVAYAQAETADRLADDLRDQICCGARDLGVGVTFRYRHGDPFRELSQTADEIRADLVVIGASTGFCHRLLPSTGSRLVRARRWPVLIVP
jgi:nucleotide-binding universal stress UspA family protein